MTTRRFARRWLTRVLVAALVVSIGYAAWRLRAPDTVESPTGVPSVTKAPPQPDEDRRCEPASADGIPAQPGAQRDLPSPAQSRAAVANLVVAPRSGGDRYCRGRFGPDTWPDLDRNGCSTRQDVLVRQAVTVATRRIASHGNTCEEAISGIWVDPYTGETLTFTNLKDPEQAQRLQIDHLVPLYNAWVSGARDWSDEQRVRFAGDLAAPELRAISGAVNFAKDHAGAESWQPAPEQRCDYARAYVEVKRVYALTVTALERDALLTMLSSCG